MRTLTAGALAKIAQKKGTEPINIVEVDWGGGPVSYADRTIDQIQGRVLEMAPLDSEIDLQSKDSQTISVILRDSDGDLKAIFNTTDIHERPVRIYQWFSGMGAADKFLLFSGKINSPITWSEADRTLSFQVWSKIEDREFGFSAEEGEFEFVPKDLVGKAWPVIFGTVLDYPALRVNRAVSGTTLCGVGILSGADLQLAAPLGGTDCSSGMSLAMMSQQVSLYNVGSTKWANADPARSDALREQANDILTQMIVAMDAQAAQEACGRSTRAATLAAAETNGLGCNPVRILGGEDFPQNTPIQLNIGGGLFTGKMVGDSFTILSRTSPENEDKAQAAFNSIEQCSQGTPSQVFDMELDVPPGSGDFGNLDVIRRKGFIVCTEIPTASRPTTPQVAQHKWYEPGTRVSMASDEEIHYIASITPGEVLSVKAYKTIGGERKLVNVPNDLWYTHTQTYGTITATYVTTRRPLGSIVDQNWDEDLYITFRSTIGPNTTDILEWIIENYTDLEADPTSFAEVNALVEPFPMNFPVLDRRNTLDLLKDIVWQARCAMQVIGDTVYLRYLPKEPASVKTITTSDIEVGKTEVSLTPTEDIITKMIVTWRLTWEDKEPDRQILRNNVPKYGTKDGDKEFFFYCYNQPDVILKAATFWLIRYSNTWKKIRFTGFLNLLNVENFDAVTLDLPSYVATGPVKAVIERSVYDSANNSIDFECLVPVRAGEMAYYPFFWPSELSPETLFVSNASNTGVTGSLPIGYLGWEGGPGEVWAGGVNIVYGQRSDRGDITPTDVGFVAQEVVGNTTFADITNVANPNPNLLLNYIDPTPPIQVPALVPGSMIIDIRRTKIIDSSKAENNPSARLDSFFREVNADGELVVSNEIHVGDGSNSADFNFQYDTVTGKFASKLAFLKE